MHSAQELLTRWPSLETAARPARLKSRLEISPGPLTAIIRAQTDAAALAASGLGRREVCVWSPRSRQAVVAFDHNPKAVRAAAPDRTNGR